MAPSGATPILLRRTTDWPPGPTPAEIAPQAWRGGSSRAFSAAIVTTEYGTHYLPVVESERPVGTVGLRDVTRSAALLAGSRAGIGLGF